MKRALLLLALLGLGPGCITVVQTTQGVAISPKAVSRVQAGKTTLRQVLTELGAPLEVHNHADGRILVYRQRARNTFRFGLSAGQATRFLDVSQVASEAIGNLRLTIERRHIGEDRVVILLDHHDVVKAVGYRARVAGLPVF